MLLLIFVQWDPSFSIEKLHADNSAMRKKRRRVTCYLVNDFFMFILKDQPISVFMVKILVTLLLKNDWREPKDSFVHECSSEKTALSSKDIN